MGCYSPYHTFLTFGKLHTLFESSLKIYFTPPSGTKGKLREIFRSSDLFGQIVMSEQELERVYEDLETEITYKKLLFSLCFFHAFANSQSWFFTDRGNNRGGGGCNDNRSQISNDA